MLLEVIIYLLAAPAFITFVVVLTMLQDAALIDDDRKTKMKNSKNSEEKLTANTEEKSAMSEENNSTANTEEKFAASEEKKSTANTEEKSTASEEKICIED